MRRHAPSARAARSLLPLIAATLAVAPAAAQASTKLDNVKAAAPAKVVCDAVAASAVPRAREPPSTMAATPGTAAIAALDGAEELVEQWYVIFLFGVFVASAFCKPSLPSLTRSLSST